MLKYKTIFYYIAILLSIFKQQTCLNQQKYNDAKTAALDTYYIFHDMFTSCVASPMRDQHFIIDDLRSFVNYPSKTTVGFAPKFTSNRNFFANMVSSPGFKDTLARDQEELRKQMIKKINFCHDVIMDENVLKEFHDREIDQNKM